MRITRRTRIPRFGSTSLDVEPPRPCGLQGCVAELWVKVGNDGPTRVHLNEVQRLKLVAALTEDMANTGNGHCGAPCPFECGEPAEGPALCTGECMSAGGTDQPDTSDATDAHECLIKDGRCIVRGHVESRPARREAWFAAEQGVCHCGGQEAHTEGPCCRPGSVGAS